MALKRPVVQQLINVHKVTGDKAAIHFLQNSEKDFVEGLFYHAKKYGHAEFYFNESQFEILRNKDFSFTIQVSPEQPVSTEQFA